MDHSDIKVKKIGTSEIQRRKGVVANREGVVTVDEYMRTQSQTVLRAGAASLRRLPGWGQLTTRQQRVLKLLESAPGSAEIERYCAKRRMTLEDFEVARDAAEKILMAAKQDEADEEGAQ